MKGQSWRFARFVACVVVPASVACATLPACDPLLGSSKVAQGQRYTSNDQRYDPYFDDVHQSQVAAAAWPDEKKAARRPLVKALTLTPDATDDNILAAAHERAKKAGGAKLDLASVHVTPSATNDGPFFSAVEETARLELERARRLTDKSDKLDALSKHGEELQKSASNDFSNSGANKADEKKTAKSREIRRELGGAVDATRGLSRDALEMSRDAQDFLEDLGAALEADGAPARRPRDKHRSGAKPLPPPPKVDKPDDNPPAKPAKPKPAAKPKSDKADKAPPGEKPPPKPAAPPDEVFNP